MAAIRKRGNRYHVQIRKKGQASLTKSFTKRSDALTWAKTVESEMERGVCSWIPLKLNSKPWGKFWSVTG